MNKSLIRFIHGHGLGEARLGMSRADIRARLGLPHDWVGKEGFGERIPTPERSLVWFFYQEALGVVFNDFEQVESLFVKPFEIKVRETPFDDWSIGPGSTMADFREFLYQNRIQFHESSRSVVPYYILANDRCLCSTSMFSSAKETLPSNREVGAIETFTEDSDVAGRVKSINWNGPYR